MSEPQFDPIFFAAVVTTNDGDARIMCMAQINDDQSANVHYIKVDTTLDDGVFNYQTADKRSFQEELRGAGLAVRITDGAVPDLKKLVETDLREAYGYATKVDAKKMCEPGI